MKVRRYFAPDMRTALAAARREQGGDAIIVGQRRVEGGLELITADEYNETLLAAFTPAEPARMVARADETAPAPAAGGAVARASQPPAAGTSAEGKAAAASQATSSPRTGTAQAETPWTREPVIEQMRNELRSLRSLLQNQFASLAWTDLRQRRPLWAYVLRRALGAGVNPRLARKLVQRVQGSLSLDHGWERFVVLFTRLLRVTGDDLMTRGGAAVLLGPTGVGKTTLVCKLAAQFALKHGNRTVALITADSQRFAAHEQLRSFGRITGITVRAVAGVDELLPALESVCDRKLILVDTAGMSRGDRNLDATLAALRASAAVVQSYIVASAATPARDLDDTFARYAPVSPVGVMLTKLDETTQLAPALSAAILRRLPIVFVSGGQRIPEDCEAAVAERLVRRALGGAVEMHAENSEVDLMMEEVFNGNGSAHAHA
ncbi:MAG: flagellar biosynthesis protein FlhF [Chromatiales bacterium]